MENHMSKHQTSWTAHRTARLRVQCHSCTTAVVCVGYGLSQRSSSAVTPWATRCRAPRMGGRQWECTSEPCGNLHEPSQAMAANHQQTATQPCAPHALLRHHRNPTKALASPPIRSQTEGQSAVNQLKEDVFGVLQSFGDVWWRSDEALQREHDALT